MLSCGAVCCGVVCCVLLLLLPCFVSAGLVAAAPPLASLSAYIDCPASELIVCCMLCWLLCGMLTTLSCCPI